MEAQMLTNWISPDALKSLNDGFVVAIMLEAREGQADALAEILATDDGGARRQAFPSLPLPDQPANVLYLRALCQRGRLGRA